MNKTKPFTISSNNTGFSFSDRFFELLKLNISDEDAQDADTNQDH